VIPAKRLAISASDAVEVDDLDIVLRGLQRLFEKLRVAMNKEYQFIRE
jgi:hypothetical protein